MNASGPDHLDGSDTFRYPSIQSAENVMLGVWRQRVRDIETFVAEPVWTYSSPTMAHTRDHEQAVKVLYGL